MRVWAVLVCLLMAAAGCPTGGEGAWGGEGEAGRSFRLKDPDLVEASGIACSLRRPGFFWIHNDSGDLPRMFAVDGKGRTAGTVLLEGVVALDWEDCALEPPRKKGGRPMLWVGDIGNNLGLPLLKVLYRFPEPDPGRLKGKVLKIPKKGFSFYRCRFPRGRQDCECLMVHPLTGIPYLVPAVNGPETGLFRWPGNLKAGRKVRILEKTASLEVPLPTPAGRRIRGGDFGPGGKWFVLRSLTHLMIYAFPSGEAGGSGGKKRSLPVLRPLLVMKAPREIQGEGVAVEPGGKALWLCGEGKGSKVYRVPLPKIRLPRGKRKK